MNSPDLSGDLDALPALISMVADDPDGATLAAWRLSQLEVPGDGARLEPQEIDQLLLSLGPSYATPVRCAVADALGRFREWEAVPLLCLLAGCDGDPELRRTAVEALGAIGDTRALGALTDALLHDVDARVRAAAADATAALGSPAAEAAVVEATRDVDVDVRRSALGALAELATNGAASAVARSAREDADADVRDLAQALAPLLPRSLPAPAGPASPEGEATALSAALDELGIIGTGTMPREVHCDGLGMWVHTERQRRGEVLVVTVLRHDGEPMENANVGLALEVVANPSEGAASAQVVTLPVGFDQHGHARLAIPATTKPMRLRVTVPAPTAGKPEGTDADARGQDPAWAASEVAAAAEPPVAPPIEVLGRGTRLWLEVVPLEGTIATVESEHREHAGRVIRLPIQVDSPSGTVALWAPLRWSEVQGICRAEVVLHVDEVAYRASLSDPVPPQRLGEEEPESIRVSVVRSREWTRVAWRELVERSQLPVELRAALEEHLASGPTP